VEHCGYQQRKFLREKACKIIFVHLFVLNKQSLKIVKEDCNDIHVLNAYNSSKE
jgi:hypothetical protein